MCLNVPFNVEDERDGVMEMYSLCSSQETGDKFRISTALAADKRNALVRNCIVIRGGAIIKRSGSVFPD